MTKKTTKTKTETLLLLLLPRETLVTAEDGTVRGKRHRSNFSRHGVQACPAPSVIGKSLYSCIVAVQCKCNCYSLYSCIV